MPFGSRKLDSRIMLHVMSFGTSVFAVLSAAVQSEAFAQRLLHDCERG